MKVRNKIGYLGFLGFLGLLGLFTGNTGFYGFFGAFGFFGAMGGYGSDERVEKNMNRAGKNAFIFATLATSLSFAYLGIFKGVEAYHPLLALPFAGSILLFVLSYTYYDKKGEV